MHPRGLILNYWINNLLLQQQLILLKCYICHKFQTGNVKNLCWTDSNIFIPTKMQQQHFPDLPGNLQSQKWMTKTLVIVYPSRKPVIKTYLYWFTINAMPRFFNDHSINSSNNSRLVDGCITSKTWQAVATDCFTWTLVPEHCELDITFHDIKIPCDHWLGLLYSDQDLREKEKLEMKLKSPWLAPHVEFATFWLLVSFNLESTFLPHSDELWHCKLEINPNTS